MTSVLGHIFHGSEKRLVEVLLERRRHDVGLNAEDVVEDVDPPR